MKLLVNYIYLAQIIKKRCRNPITIPVKGSVSVEIKEFGSLPVAFRLGENELFWDEKGKTLWEWEFSRYDDLKKERISKDTVEYYTRNDAVDYKYSGPGVEAPFHNIWHRANLGIGAWLKDEDVLSRPDIEETGMVRKWIGDNLEEVEALIKDKASKIAVMEGYMLKQAKEPIYHCITFGLGGNHGGTALMLTSTNQKVIEEAMYFPANQLDEAIAHTEEVATNRGDTKYLPIKPDTVVEVLIPEAVQVKKVPKIDFTKEPCFCPKCQSDRLGIEKLESDLGIAWRKVQCDTCGAAWREDFVFTSFKFI